MWLWMKLFSAPPVAWGTALIATGIALVAAAVVAEMITALVRRSLGSSGPERPGEPDHARPTARVVRPVAWALLVIVFVPPALEFFGLQLRTGIRLSMLTSWLLSSGLKVVLIAGTAFVLMRAVRITTHRFEQQLKTDGPTAEQAKRARTLGEMTRNVSSAVILTVAILYILKELRFDIMPLLTTAGIAGLAVGFGAQTLVKDVISGFFLILEDQVRVGDVAEINGTSGLVEALHLRTLVLRDARGAVHTFPCGSINTLANLTKDFSYAVLDMQVQNKRDTDKVLDALRRAGTEMRQDAEFGSMILEEVEVLGVDNQGPTGATIRIRLKTVPLRQWDVARELRKRLRKEVGFEGIDIPIVQALPGVKPDK
jgi:moderate conductance mechanosensitive channel